MSWVFEHSEATGLERLILQSHGNHANGSEPPWHSYLGVDSVSHETRASRRGVQKALRRLEASGRLRDTGERRGGAPVYEIVLDAVADTVDREARLKREAAENDRTRGANRVRPAESAPSGEPGSPDGANEGRPEGANSGTPGGELQAGNASSSSPEPSGTNREPTAANAAAVSADAPVGSTAAAAGSSSTEKPGDLGEIYWDRAADLLVTAGFEPSVVHGDRLKLKTELRKHADRLPLVDWPALGAQLKAGRADGSIYATTPVGVLRFGLGQRSAEHLTGQATRPPRSGAAGSAGRSKDGLALPEPDEQAATAWREVTDGLEELPNWDAIASRSGVSGSLLAAARPIRFDGAVLEVSADQDLAELVELRVVPLADEFAKARLNGRVRWLDRTTAATPTTKAA
jgi:hypothetical protein